MPGIPGLLARKVCEQDRDIALPRLGRIQGGEVTFVNEQLVVSIVSLDDPRPRAMETRNDHYLRRERKRVSVTNEADRQRGVTYWRDLMVFR
jgi:hypothetical protein